MQKLGDSQLAYRKLVDRTAQDLTELRKFSAETAGRQYFCDFVIGCGINQSGY
jgi:hypothetical protein